ncbi:MAG: hypothetical protein AAGI48_00390 [Verrucomicrobiota bacterium]
MILLRFLAAALLLALILPVQAGGKKGKNASIAFHIETDPGDNPKMIFQQFVDGKQRTFRLVPEIGTTDIVNFNPFPSRDGEGFGLVLRIKKSAMNRLAAVTAANQGRWLLARINGRIVDGVLIDRQITDGELVIWKGVSLAEVNELDKELPRFGAKKPRG